MTIGSTTVPWSHPRHNDKNGGRQSKVNHHHPWTLYKTDGSEGWAKEQTQSMMKMQERGGSRCNDERISRWIRWGVEKKRSDWCTRSPSLTASYLLFDNDKYDGIGCRMLLAAFGGEDRRMMEQIGRFRVQIGGVLWFPGVRWFSLASGVFELHLVFFW